MLSIIFPIKHRSEIVIGSIFECTQLRKKLFLHSTYLCIQNGSCVYWQKLIHRETNHQSFESSPSMAILPVLFVLSASDLLDIASRLR